MPQRKHPRRVVLDVIADMKRTIHYMSPSWTATIRVWDEELGRWRERRFDERPENQPERWEQLAHNARVLADYCQEMIDYAEAQAAVTRHRQEMRN